MIKAKNKSLVQYIIILAVILVMATICATFLSTSTASAKSDFSQGTGTEENPFVVTTVKEFNAIATRLDAYFVQGANIDFTGEEFYPIGDLTHPFTGHYDGNQYLLTGINAYCPNKDNVGVFSFIYKGGVVKNVRVENSTFIGNQNVGAIAGMNAGRIEGAVANSDVTSNTNAAGGVVGANSGYISCSVNSGNVKALGMYAGGISGVNTGNISDIYNKGSVSAQTYVGGIAGLNNGKSSKAVIERAFQVGEVSGNVRGNVSGDNMNAAIKQCRYIQGSDIKAISAFNSGGNIMACIARPAYEFKTKSAFSDWIGFENNFMFLADVNHPILRAEYVKVSGIEFGAGKSIKLRPGDELELGAYVTPSHASVQKIKLDINSGGEFCLLTDGVIKIKNDAQVGSFITVVGEAEGVVGLTQIKIVPIRVESIELMSNDNRETVVPGAQLQLSTKIYPNNASIKDVRYTSSNSLADIDADGVLRVSQDAPVGLIFTVTASSYDNISISDVMTFTVIEAQVKSVDVTNTVTDFKVTGSLNLMGLAVTESLTTDEVEFEIIPEKTTAEGARIVGGKLYADLPGEISVFARYAGANSEPVVFVAKEEPVTSIEFLNNNSFPINQALNIIALALPDYATFRDVTLTLVGGENTGAMLNGNILTAESTGMITIRAEASGVYATITVYAEPASEVDVDVTGISLAKDSYLLTRTLTLVPVIEPSNAQAAVYFEIVSDGGTGVELVNGKLQNAKRPGLILLCAYTSKFRTYVTVEAQKVEVENVYFTNVNRFKITKSLALNVATNPANPTYPEVNYQIISSTANGADISDGILTAQSVGEIVLRAWVDGVPSSEFKVYADKEPVTDVRFTSSSKSFKHTESLILEAMALPMQATYKNVEFHIDESGTTDGIEANINNGNVLTAKAPGVVTVIMSCDGHDYPVIISVDKEPVIGVSELETRLWTKNTLETEFKTSGILELTAYVYPFNATYQNIEISIVNDGGTKARFVNTPDEKINWDNNPVTAKRILAGEKNAIYLAARYANNITVRVKSLDNTEIYSDYNIVVNEEYVSEIYFGMLSDSAINTAKLAQEDISSDMIVGNRNEKDYYYFNKMFFITNQLDENKNLKETYSLTYSVFAYANDRVVEPTFDDEYELYYYKNYDDYQNKNIEKRIKVGSDEDKYLVKQGSKLIANTKKVTLWLIAVSKHGEKNAQGNQVEIVSDPMELTIYPTNIADLKSLAIDETSGIIKGSKTGTASIKDMSGYEVTVKSNKINFTKFISTQYTELWLKLYKYSVKSYDVTVDVLFDYGKDDEYRFRIPTENFHGIQSIPKNQVSSNIQGGSQYNAIVIYDFNFNKYTFNNEVEFDNGVKYMYLYGNQAQQHLGINFVFNNVSPVEITLHDINYVANASKHAIRIKGDGHLTLNVLGNVTIQGGASSNGKNGSDGKSYSTIERASSGARGKDGNMNWNPFGDVPSGQDGFDGSKGNKGGDGENGKNGTNGGFAIRLAKDNNITLNIESPSMLKLVGINGGNGGDGGDGGRGQNGGHGGGGGNGDVKYAVFAAVPGNGGNGGNGGRGGNGGSAGDGGNAGRGGLSINASNVKNKSNVIWIDGEDGKVGKAGTRGKGGYGGYGGYGGSKGEGLILGITYNGKDGSPGKDGEDGNYGNYGIDGILADYD